MSFLLAVLRTAAAVLPFVLAAPLQASDLSPFCGLLCFHSADPSPVEVTMLHELQRDRQAHLTIPRSALIYVPDMNAARRDVLPDRIETDGPWVKFAIVAPDGRPFGEAVEELAHATNFSLNMATTKLRPNYAIVDISLIGRDIPDDRLYAAHLLGGMDWKYLKQAEPFDGLPARILSFETKSADGTKRSGTGHQTNYFPLNADDPFLMIQCENQPHPVYWCTYFIRVSDLVKLTVHMSDFRVYGGRKFVQDRLNMVLRAYCKYDVACNP